MGNEAGSGKDERPLNGMAINLLGLDLSHAVDDRGFAEA